MIYDWNREKDEQLQVERGVSFLDVVEAVSGSGFVADIAHPNHGKYGHQRVLVVDIGGYAYYVPYVVQEDGTRFLKTAFPSRNATKKYLSK